MNFLNFSDQKFSLVIVLNFWANLSLGVLIKFVLIKKRACIDEWIVDNENLNYVRLKIKTKKKPTCGYALQNYYRCIHNTRDWSPSKNPRRKLKLNPSARVKNTNCPFQMVVKIKQESCCTVDIECEHKQSVQSLEASHFRDVPPECVERVYLLFESGLTPSTARHQHLRWFETVFHFPFQLNFMKGLLGFSKRLLLLVDSRCCNNLSTYQLLYCH